MMPLRNGANRQSLLYRGNACFLNIILIRLTVLSALLSCALSPAEATPQAADEKKDAVEATRSLDKQLNDRDRHMNIGADLQNRKLYDSAIQEYKISLGLDALLPAQEQEEARILFSLGSIYQARKDYVAAAGWYTRALQKRPGYAAAQEGLRASRELLSGEKLSQPVATGGAPASGNPASAAKVDFGPYMKELQHQIKQSWHPPRNWESKHVTVLFKVWRDGTLTDLRLDKKSGSLLADEAALEAVQRTAPFARLPNEAPKNVDISFTFDYNVHATPSGLEHSLALLKDKAGDNRQRRADLLLQLGEAYASKGDMDKAKENFQMGISATEELNGKCSEQAIEAYGLEAQSLYGAQKQYSEAGQIFSQVELSASEAKKQEALALAQSLRAEIVEEPQMHWSIAEQLLQRAHQQARNNVKLDNKITFLLVDCYLKEGKHKEAIEVLSETLDSRSKTLLDADGARILLRIANLQAELYKNNLHDSERAMQTLESVHSLFQTRFGEKATLTLEALHDCGTLAAQINDKVRSNKYMADYRTLFYEGRLAAWEKAVAVTPTVENILSYGICLEDAGKKADAARQYQKALNLSPNDWRIQELLKGLSATSNSDGKLDEDTKSRN